MSTGELSARIVSAQATTDSKSESSSASGVVLPRTCRHASSARCSERLVPMTHAPRIASTRIVSKPMPDVHPVTTAILPDRSMPSVTCSAVESSSKSLRGTPGAGTLS